MQDVAFDMVFYRLHRHVCLSYKIRMDCQPVQYLKKTILTSVSPPGDAVLAVKGANFLSNGDLTDIFLYFCFRKAELNVPV